MIIDEEGCYRAVESKDQRFDGWFFVGVTSTGIFCRPSCPATTPEAAQRPLLPHRRCSPGRRVPGVSTLPARHGAGLARVERARRSRRPGDGADRRRARSTARGSVGVASRMAVSERHLHRVLVQELGAGPLALARSRRAQTARILIETTELALHRDRVRRRVRQHPPVQRHGPRVLRRQPHRPARRPHHGDQARPLRHRPIHGQRRPAPARRRSRCASPPADRSPATELIGFLAMRAIPGVEAVDADGTYHRVLRLPSGLAIVSLRAEADHVSAHLLLADLRDLGPAVARCRRLLDLDADPEAIDELLGADPQLGPLVAATPGRRSPGAVDGTELLVRAIIGQQVSVAGARTVASRVAAALGDPLPPRRSPRPRRHQPALSHAFPDGRGAGCGRPDDVLHAAGAGPGADHRLRTRGRRESSSSTRDPIGTRWSSGCSRSRASDRGPPPTWPCGP